MQLQHINIRAPMALLEQEKAFFCETLGLHEGPRPQFSGRGYWLYSGDDAIVHLSEGTTQLDDPTQGYLDHIAFEMSDLPAVIQTLRDKDVEYTTSYLPDADMTQIFVTAPSNTRIELNFIGEKI